MINIDEYKQRIATANTEQLGELHDILFSKKGLLRKLFAEINSQPIDEKKKLAQNLNEKKQFLLNLFQQRQEILLQEQLQLKIDQDSVDLSLPVHTPKQGGINPISFVMEEIIYLFSKMGFEIAIEQDIEEDWYNFTALNIAEHHPARDNHDTFYLNVFDNNGNRKLLRTHTSNTQIKIFTNLAKYIGEKDHIKIISPGRTYRNDNDSTHSPMFHQIEGFYLTKSSDVTIDLLKRVISNFCNEFFALENNDNLRFRSSYFPFTSPSFEVDIRDDKSSSWLEILGCGIIDNKVLENCNINSDLYQGFAFGIGIERLVMLKYGFNDLRELFKNDIRWLSKCCFNIVNMPSLHNM